MTTSGFSRYDNDRFFITPDRKCEQFMYNRGFSFCDTLKGETGWTYWVYERSPSLSNAIADYCAYLTKRREASAAWRLSAQTD